MEFTNQQKLIVTLLTDIHENLGVRNSVDPEFVRRVVNDDQGWALAWKYPGLFSKPESDPEEVTYVAEVLEMWSQLEESFLALSTAEKSQLSTAAFPLGSDVKFSGFDGNNESSYRSAAKVIVGDLGLYSEFAGRDLNSHMRTTENYKRMLAEFDRVRNARYGNVKFNLLDVNEIAQILKA